jgi:hypothetical protein
MKAYDSERKVKLYFIVIVTSFLTTDGQLAGLSWYQTTTWDPLTIILASIEILIIYLPFFVMGLPFWREDSSVIFSGVAPESEPRRSYNQTLLSHWRLRSRNLYPQGTGRPR